MNDGVGSDDGPAEDTEAADEFLQGQEGKSWLTFSSNNVSYLLILVIDAIFVLFSCFLKLFSFFFNQDNDE